MDDRLDWWKASEALGQLSGQVAQLHFALISTTARVIADEAWAGAGIRSVEHFLEVKTGLDRGTVRKIVKLARRADELPEALALLHQGRLTLDQAAVLADHAPASHSADVTRFAEQATVTQLRRGLINWFPEDRRPTPAVDPDEPASLHLSSYGGRFTLKYTTGDLVAGELLEQAIREAKDALFTAGSQDATLADGLVEVASRSLAAIGTPSRRARYRVLVHLDTDARAWLHKKGALPSHLAEQYTCDGTVVPVWHTNGHTVAVGRSQRIIPDRVRVLIEDRDKGCRYPGCHTTGFLEDHHLRHWRDGGATDPSNLVSLCNYHHAEHHRGGFTIEGDPERVDGLVFRSQYGQALTPARAQPPPPPPTPPPGWRGPTGEPLHTRWLDFRPNPSEPQAAPAA
ncbi:MAG: DUF222 domain-containing protein [Propionicimonas sp.]|nr:DUF222 domain-containing protein [Propionicimonas sp.]